MSNTFLNVMGYDIESYPNFFSVGFQCMTTDHTWYFEISQWQDDRVALVTFLSQLQDFYILLGFNNEAFDYQILHAIILQQVHTAEEINALVESIINAQRHDKFARQVAPWDYLIRQIDLLKIMHFDNFARATSLKALEIAMRSEIVEDLPFPPGTVLEEHHRAIVASYMARDINETVKFAREVEDRIAFRMELGEKFVNFNDTRIGKQTFIDELEAAGIPCFTKINGKREPIQTHRDQGIVVRDKLLNVPFRSAALLEVWHKFHAAVIDPWETKGFFKDFTAPCGNIKLEFGTGGLHGSVDNLRFDATETHEILDIDVVSYYPSLAIVNRWYPQHLTDRFCDVYSDLKKRRVSYAKGTPENAALKLALNGVYGDSNNVYSPFYDPAYTMAITINGQLLLAWLAEALSQVPGVTMIQCNTDGATIYAPRDHRVAIDNICKAWERATSLELEYVNYQSMIVRDVNNYIAVGIDGKVKRKNAYLTETDWHQDPSSLVVPKAASAALVDGQDAWDFIINHRDKFDFMRRAKVQRNHVLMWGDQEQQRTSRYYVVRRGHGERLTKKMPPLKGKTEMRTNEIDKGFEVRMCNDAKDFDWSVLNWDFYRIEARKLIDCIRPFNR